MFVNDTGRLPDSGRVCVVRFQRDPAASKTYYNVAINAARAEVEPMGEPRNPAHVLGVGSEIQTVKGPVFAAYFAATRDRYDMEPNYKGGLFVLVDGAVYGVRQENVSTSIRRGILLAALHPDARRPPAAQRRISLGLASAILELRRTSCTPCPAWCSPMARKVPHENPRDDRAGAHGRQHGEALDARRHRLRGARCAARLGARADG